MNESLKKSIYILIIMTVTMLSVGIVSGAPSVPSCDFTANVTSGQEDLTVTFTAEYDGITPPVTYEWDFGDDSGAYKLSGASITHTYFKPGKYDVRLAVNDVGIPTTWWVSNTKSDFITVTNVPPVADFTYTPIATENVPSTKTFTSTSTGVVDTYLWDFGDNTTSTAESPEHTYLIAGEYDVTLTVSNDGGSDSKTKSITVNPPLQVTDFDVAGNKIGGKPFAVQFVDKSTYDGESFISYHWTFGDGQESNQHEPIHVYLTEGNYTVTLQTSTVSGIDSETKPEFIHVLKDPIVCPKPGADKIGIFRDGAWSLDSDGDYVWEGADAAFSWGVPGDIKVVGDWNGDGKDDVGVFRNGAWSIDSNGNGIYEESDKTSYWGLPGDIPVVGDWNADGKSDIGIFRPTTGYWSVDSDGDYVWEGTDKSLKWGLPGDVPVVGSWINPF